MGPAAAVLNQSAAGLCAWEFGPAGGINQGGEPPPLWGPAAGRGDSPARLPVQPPPWSSLCFPTPGLSLCPGVWKIVPVCRSSHLTTRSGNHVKHFENSTWGRGNLSDPSPELSLLFFCCSQRGPGPRGYQGLVPARVPAPLVRWGLLVATVTHTANVSLAPPAGSFLFFSFFLFLFLFLVILLGLG